MADKQKKTAAAPPQPIKPDDSRKTADDDVVGKAYDGRLMRRLVRYLAPYKLQVAVSAVAIVLKAASDVLGPYFVKVAVDKYFAPTNEKHSWLAGRLSSSAVRLAESRSSRSRRARLMTLRRISLAADSTG